MSGHKSNAFILAGKQVSISVFRFGQDLQIGVITNQLGREIGVARMRGQERVIETARQQRMWMKNVVFVYARELFSAGLLGDAIKNIQCGLYRPTDKQCGGNVIFCPLQNLFDLRPVGDIVKFNQAERRAGHDQSVEVFTLNVIEVTVEVVQMLRWRVT